MIETLIYSYSTSGASETKDSDNSSSTIVSYIGRKVKVEIAVSKGKKLYDKRHVKKTRDWNREKARLLSKNK